MTAQPVRVVIFAPEQLVLEALAEAFAVLPGLHVVGRASTEAGVSQLLGTVPVDVLVLHAAGGHGVSLDLARSALEQAHELGIVLVTEPGASDVNRHALEIGVRGWVRSDEPLERLISAVRRVGAHDMFIPISLMTSVLVPPQPGATPGSAHQPVRPLTPRQSDVLRCLMDGHSREETGLLLNMSPNTVRTHVGAILRRRQVHSTLAAVAEAHRSGLLVLRADEASTTKGEGGLGR